MHSNVRIGYLHTRSQIRHTAVVGTVQSLLGSARPVKVITVPKTSSLLRYKYIVYRTEVTSLCFCNVEETFGAACAVLPPRPACNYTRALEDIKLSKEDYMEVMVNLILMTSGGNLTFCSANGDIRVTKRFRDERNP